MFADFRGVFFAVRAFQPDERRVGITVNHVIALRLHQRFRLAHNFVPTHGDRRGQTRIEEAAGAGTQHAVKSIHNDLQRLGERFIAVSFGFFATVPDLADNFWQAVFLARKTCA
ncbi:hypothetical protein D3C78_1007480 [compost metagenome]